MTEATYSLPEHVMCQRTGDAMVLLDTEKGQYYELNDTACAAFLYVLDLQDPAAAAGRLAQDFDVSEAQAHTDVAALLEDLLNSGLVRQAAEPTEK